MEQYKDFAFVYDELMNEVDYNGWVKYIEDIIKNENAQVQNILELACGTGNLTIPLTKKNYDIAGIDISEEMLSVAREKAEKEGVELVLLQQDIAELDFVTQISIRLLYISCMPTRRGCCLKKHIRRS